MNLVRYPSTLSEVETECREIHKRFEERVKDQGDIIHWDYDAFSKAQEEMNEKIRKLYERLWPK
jgi:hypothetical protein